MSIQPLQLAITGCGGMGRRHLAGLAELRHNGFHHVDLIAVCDLNEHNATDLADEAAGLLGLRPAVFTDFTTMVQQTDGLEAAGCTTDSGSHHLVATGLLNLGLHVLCEKPLALTIRGCQQIIAAAAKSGCILSVAENYRRDPMNRLVRALIDNGAIGNRQFMIETTVGGGDGIFITPWRHQKLTGTITLDAGVHNADILQYYFGDALTAYGQTRIFHPVRVKKDTSGPGGFYDKWSANMPGQIDATGADALFGLITFEAGAVGQWVQHHAGHGAQLTQRIVYGTRGSIEAPGDRNGRPVRMTLDGGRVVDDDLILDYAPNYRLDHVGAAMFGSERPWTYSFSFVETDRKLIAMEYAELAGCVRSSAPPEVDGAVAMRAIALVCALFESKLAGRPVSIAEIEANAVDEYQREIDLHYGLLPV